MNNIALQFVIPKRMHSRAGSPGKTLIDITVKVNYSCTVSDMPFNCQDGGEEVEGENEGGTAQGGGAGGKGEGVLCSVNFTLPSAHCKLYTSHCTLHTAHFTLHISHCTLHTSHCTLRTAHFTLHSAHFTLHTSHCTLQGTRPSQTTWSPYCWLPSHSCKRTWETSCCFSRYTLQSTLIPPQAPQPYHGQW